MHYENLKPVNIAFILTSHEENQAVRRIKLCDIETYKVYDDIFEITLVYVKKVLKTVDKKSKLYIFARFFSISNQRDADNFVKEFEKEKLGKELILMYNKAVSNVNKLRKIEASPYFTERLNEAQLEEERKEAAEKGAEKEREKWIGVVLNKDAELANKDVELANKDAEISTQAAELAKKDAIIAEYKKRLNEDK